MKKRYSLNQGSLEGVWIDDSGKSYPVTEHLIFIQSHPDIFYLTSRDVKNASIEQLRKFAVQAIKEGFIRARFLSPNGYLFEISRASKENFEKIEGVLLDSESYGGEKIIIEAQTPPRTYEGKVSEFYDRTMFKYYENPKKRRGGWRFSK